MPNATEQRKFREVLRDVESGREPGRKADAFASAKDLDAMKDGEELAPETAQRLQAKVGNQALNNMLNKNNSASQNQEAGLGVEVEEEEAQEVDEELDKGEDEGAEHEETQRQFGGGGGGAGGAGGAGGNPWDVDNLFGGDDDDAGDGQPRRRRRMRPSPIRNFPGMGAQDLLGERPHDALDDADLSGIDAALGMLPPVQEEDRWGDARYQAIEAALLDPRRIGRRTTFEPEDLIDRTGVLDPIGRPGDIGRFLAESGDGLLSRSLARVLGGPSAALLHAASGHAGAAARLAALAVCCEALEGGGETTDRAVAVAMRRDAWPTMLQAAQEVGAYGPLRAPDLLRHLLGPSVDDEDRPEEVGLPTSPLGGRALDRVVPEGPIPPVPSLALGPQGPPVEEDETVAAVDAFLDRILGGVDPSEAPDPNLSPEDIAPVLEAATGLVSALGRAQVELAAAALAVRRVYPRAPVRGVLHQSDDVLRRLARAVMTAGRGLEGLVGAPIVAVEDTARARVGEIREAAATLPDLRVWALSALGDACSP